MKTIATGMVLLCLFLPLAGIGDDRIRVCDQDVTDPAHRYSWLRLKQRLPENLGPGDEVQAYGDLANLYLQGLTDEDRQRADVKKFVELLGQISTGVRSANVVIKPGLQGEVLYSGADKVTDLGCSTPVASAVVDMSYMTIALKKVHTLSWSVLMGATNARIQALSRQYADWFNNGLPMWPLETWANGLLLDKHDAVAPKRWQLVLARPSLGVGINSGKSVNSSKPESTLAIEPIGYVRYTSDDYSKYWGVSLMMTVGDDKGVGGGVLCRYRNYVVGVTKRQKDIRRGISGDDLYLFVGLDVYNLFHTQQERFDGLKQKVRENLQRVKESGGLAPGP